MIYKNTIISCSLIKDDYKNGEELNGSNWYETYEFKSSDIKDVINQICDHYELDIANAIVFDNDIIINGITDNECLPLSESELNAWKEGKQDAYSFSIRFSIDKVESVLHDDLLILTGIESYD